MEVVLYILVRNDLASLVGSPSNRVAGKACAQAAHAANQFVTHIRRLPMIDEHDELFNLFRQWETSTPDGFGTTITLGVNLIELKTAIMVARACGLTASITHDPTYPINDSVEGQPPVIHLIPLDTGGYVFGCKNEIRPVLYNYDLLP